MPRHFRLIYRARGEGVHRRGVIYRRSAFFRKSAGSAAGGGIRWDNKVSAERQKG